MHLAPVSVVIPTFNAATLVTQAIDSVLAQTVRPAEIIVVDDGSADDTQQRLAAYGTRIVRVRQPNQGVSAARNRGVETAGQEFVAFLDADDVWHPRKVELQMPVFEHHPGLGLVGADFFGWPVSAFPKLEGAPARVGFVSWEQLVVKNALTTSAVVVRRDVLRRAGRFDTTIQGPEDRDLWLRVAELAPVANLELPLVGYRDVQGSVSKQAARCQAGMLRILHKLDERRAWRGRWRLRRKAYSYVYHSVSCLYGEAGQPGKALGCSLKSLLWYPLPYRRREVATAAERPKRCFVHLLRWLGLKAAPSSRPGTVVDVRPDALQALHARP